MKAEQVATLAASGESEALEFKETTGTRREATMTVCAFVNQSGGQVLFGVAGDGAVAGQQVSERTVEELSAELQRIDPPAFPEIKRVPVEGGREVIVVSTRQGASRPYTYRGVAYRRVGNTTLAMSGDECNRMLFERMHSEQRWENQPAPGWSVDDLDVAEKRSMRLIFELLEYAESNELHCAIRAPEFDGHSDGTTPNHPVRAPGPDFLGSHWRYEWLEQLAMNCVGT